MPDSAGSRLAVPFTSRPRWLVATLSLLLLFGIFVLDVVTLEVTVYALFAVVVLLSVLAQIPGLVMVNAMIASALIVLGAFLSHLTGSEFERAIINRGVSLVAVWTTVILSLLIEHGRRALVSRDRLLQRLATEDPLTGVANRRRFEEQLHIECQRALREQAWLALIMIDIDHFKEYNDHLGHPLGDECLVRIANSAQLQLHRPSDLIARYGGEEFAVLLPTTDRAGAEALAEQIRQAVEALDLSHPTRRRVTISLGVAALRPDDSTNCRNRLLDAADRALYQAKDAGRNRVMMAAG